MAKQCMSCGHEYPLRLPSCPKCGSRQSVGGASSPDEIDLLFGGHEAQRKSAEHSQAGGRFFVSGDLAGARREFEAAVRDDPNSADDQENLGVTLCKLGLYSEAVTHLEKALHLQPGKTTARQFLAQARTHGRERRPPPLPAGAAAERAPSLRRPAAAAAAPTSRPHSTERMSTPALLSAAIVAAIAAAAVTAFAFVEMSREHSAPPPTGPDVAALQQELEVLRAELRQQQRAEPAAAAPSRAEVPTISDAQVAAAIDRWLQARGEELPLAEAAAQRQAGSEIDVDEVFASLRGGASMWNNTELYKRLHAAGKLEELIERFEAQVEANPNDAQARMDLGNAYLANLQLDQTKYQLSFEADKQFDAVLALDENHWEARFTKAVSYSFWPDFLGKKKEAVAHFERLVEQQASMPVRDYQAQTYLFLGNLLDQRGDHERAQEVWRRGLQRHPNSSDLRGKVGQ